MSNIIQRTLTGALYIALVILSLIIHPLVFGIITIVFNYIAIRELSRMPLFPGSKKSNIPVILSCLIILGAIIIIHYKFSLAYIIFSLIAFIFTCFAIILFRKEGNPVSNLANIFFGFIYITLPLVILNLVQQTSVSKGIPFTLALFIFIWTNDTFAYLSGIAFGRHKMFERISPKKSWEGFIGGLIMTASVSLIFYKLYPGMGYMNWVVFGSITTLAAVFGDFIESMIKRTAGVKDSGSIMPGHGGILDRIDSLLFAGPVIYIFLFFILK
jgi:phosphatidate cytidylyltransferase